MIPSPTRRRLLHPLAVLAVGALTWASGCDFTRVDEGADVPLQQHLEALETAATPDQAERAIRGILNKVGVRTSWRADVPDEELAFASYRVTDEQVRALAQEHARYVSGDRGAAASVSRTHEAVVEADDAAEEILRNLEVGLTAESRGSILVNAIEASTIFQAEIAAALEAPEAPSNAIVLAIAADGAALPSARAAFGVDRPLSPAQRLLYTVWLHHNGPLMFPFLSEDIDSLPTEPDSDDAAARLAGTSTRDRWQCDACCGGSGKFVSMTLQYMGPPNEVEARISNPTRDLNGFKPFPQTALEPFQLFTVSGAGRPGSRGLEGTIGNNVKIYVGANASTKIASIHTSCSEPVYPGMVFGNEYGKVLVVAVRTQRNGLCSNLQVCTGSCKAQLYACKFRAGDDAEASGCP